MNRHPAQPGKTCLIDAPDSLVIGRLEFELSDQPSEFFPFFTTSRRSFVSPT
jgi:hypothetical protein